jgi:uncharacterized membrane protein YhaH (DUF805 family)
MIHAFANVSTLLAQTSTPSSGGEGGAAGVLSTLVFLALFVLVLAGFWKVFTKAGQPGWVCIIPIVNIYFLLKVAGRPGWWLILFFIPFVNFIISIVVSHDISRSFGRGIGTTVGLVLVPFVFYPVLGFGSAAYQGPAAAGGAAEPVPTA